MKNCKIGPIENYLRFKFVNHLGILLSIPLFYFLIIHPWYLFFTLDHNSFFMDANDGFVVLFLIECLGLLVGTLSFIVMLIIVISEANQRCESSVLCSVFWYQFRYSFISHFYFWR